MGGIDASGPVLLHPDGMGEIARGTVGVDLHHPCLLLESSRLQHGEPCEEGAMRNTCKPGVGRSLCPWARLVLGKPLMEGGNKKEKHHLILLNHVLYLFYFCFDGWN
jgi:hypothetical protein